MPPADVKPVRVKVYGLFWMTKRTYLRIEVVGFALLLGLLAAGAVAAAEEGRWLPHWDAGGKPVTNAWVVRQAFISLFWLALLVVVLEGLEVFVVLRLFARAEAQERARQADTATPAAEPPASKPEP